MSAATMVLAEADPATGEPRPGARESELRLAPGSPRSSRTRRPRFPAHADRTRGPTASIILSRTRRRTSSSGAVVRGTGVDVTAPAGGGDGEEEQAGYRWRVVFCCVLCYKPRRGMHEFQRRRWGASLRASPAAAEGPRHAVPRDDHAPARCRCDAFAPTACTIVEQSFGNRQTAFQSATAALPGRANKDTHSIDAIASGTAAAIRKHASGSANSWNRMLRKTIDEKTANGAAFFALRTQGRFSPTTKRVCGITAAVDAIIAGVGVGAGSGRFFFFLNSAGAREAPLERHGRRLRREPRRC